MGVAFTDLSNAIRALSMDAVQAANSGHPGMPMGMADVATVLYRDYLRYDPANPDWADRDRFVLSAGHGSMLIYALLHLTGYAKPTMADIRGFRQLSSPCAGHPENFMLDGVEATTGPLGQGLAMSVGMAMAERHLNSEFGDDLVDHRTWVIAGDGCLMEGVNHEAIGLAGHLGLGRLNVLWDDNKITIDGSTDLSTSEDIRARYRATGWHVVDCDGHDETSIKAAMEAALASDKPSLICCATIIGKGAPNKQGTSATHGSALGEEEVAAARETLGWQHPPFEIPPAIADAWKAFGERGGKSRKLWQEKSISNSDIKEFTRRMSGDLPDGFSLDDYIDGVISNPKKVATRKASELVLEAINPMLPETIGGSADLTGSNNTKTPGLGVMTSKDYSGRYVNYGIREFGMSAAMNGMALHGGIIPYGGTFLVFTDYARAAIRLSAVQRIRVIYVMTHDSIGLGEDGPTHQPVEHVMSLRLMPNLQTFRPADVVETAECWEIALNSFHTPSVIALTRQGLPQLRVRKEDGNLCAKGAYRLKDSGKTPDVTLMATGSEVSLAVETAERLENAGISAAVVSMPCWSIFDAQEKSYQDKVLPEDGSLRVSIEAGTTVGWERYTGHNGLRFGLDQFGASAPIDDLFEKYGLTVDQIVPKVQSALNKH